MTNNEALTKAIKIKRDFAELNTQYGLEFEINDDMWLFNGDGIIHNGEHNKEHLLENDGDSYSLEYARLAYEDEQYAVFYAHDCFGDANYHLFFQENRVHED